MDPAIDIAIIETSSLGDRSYLGWLYRWGAPLTLIGDDEDQIADAQRELVRIGIDELAGAAVGEIEQLSAATPLRSYRVVDFSDVADRPDGATVLDVRQTGEYEDSHIPGAVNIPLHELDGRMAEVPDGEVWVHCGSGYRASVAASMLDAAERTVVLIDDEFENADKQGLTRP